MRKKRKKSGKVIRLFTVEVSADPALASNPTNPYTQLSEKERMKDLVEIFGLLWGESCKEASETRFLKL